MIHTAAM